MQRERTRQEEADEDSERRSTRRLQVSDRTSWSGLAKRAYNVVASGGWAGGGLRLGGVMLLGAIVAGLVPLPFTWLVGAASGAAVGAWGEVGSPVTAGVAGLVIGLVFGLTFAPVLFGLGVVFTLLLGVAGGAAGVAGYFAGE